MVGKFLKMIFKKYYFQQPPPRSQLRTRHSPSLSSAAIVLRKAQRGSLRFMSVVLFERIPENIPNLMKTQRG